MATTVPQHSIGDYGTPFIFTLVDADTDAAIDVSSGTSLEAIFRKPDGTIVVKTASFVTDGTDGRIQYVTVSGDLDQAGRWRRWAKLTISGGPKTSTVRAFDVRDNTL